MKKRLRASGSPEQLRRGWGPGAVKKSGPASIKKRLRLARGAGVPNVAPTLGWPAGGKRG